MKPKINLLYENNGVNNPMISDRFPYLNAMPTKLALQTVSKERISSCTAHTHFGNLGSIFYKLFSVNTTIPKGSKFYYPITFDLQQLLSKVEQMSIPIEVIDEINNGMCKVLIVCVYEGWDWPIFEALISPLAANHNIDVDKFVVVSANFTKHYMYHTIYFNHWEISSRYTADYREIAYDTIFNQSPREYKFICLNRRSTLHRFPVVTKLFPYRNQGLLSFWQKGYTQDDGPPKLTHYNYQKNQFAMKFPGVFQEWETLKIENSLPLVLPSEFDPYDIRNSNPVDDSYIEKFFKSYLHIVTETKTESQGFFSEKTFKPFMYFQPFVFVGQYQGLAKLRDLGYKTFSSIIDESYDNEINTLLRIEKASNAAINFINRNDLHEVMKQIWPILEHNNSLFRQRFDLIIDNLSLDLKHYL